MSTVNVYDRYYSAKCVFSGRERHAALVLLIAESGGGEILYRAGSELFPHDTKDDFAVSCDTCASKKLYSGKGRRSKKREAEYLKSLEEICDELARNLGGSIFWDNPLICARLG